jgi:hypothetical protein
LLLARRRIAAIRHDWHAALENRPKPPLALRGLLGVHDLPDAALAIEYCEIAALNRSIR